MFLSFLAVNYSYSTYRDYVSKTSEKRFHLCLFFLKSLEAFAKISFYSIVSSADDDDEYDY